MAHNENGQCTLSNEKENRNSYMLCKCHRTRNILYIQVKLTSNDEKLARFRNYYVTVDEEKNVTLCKNLKDATHWELVEYRNEKYYTNGVYYLFQCMNGNTKLGYLTFDDKTKICRIGDWNSSVVIQANVNHVSCSF